MLRKLQAETFVFNLSEPRREAPLLPGYKTELTDDHTLEVEVSKGQSLNDIFAQLSAQGIARQQHAQQGQPARGAVHAAGR